MFHEPPGRLEPCVSCEPPAGLPLSADILLNDSRLSDAGVYRCVVTNLPEAAHPGIGELELRVLGIVSSSETHL